jgi:16S rRNA (guanine966-N2)-methyltransferase
MKILGGRYKGLSIDTSKKLSYRPTQSRIRKSVFDILRPFGYIKVLDLYSGSGILGFESASRGAGTITFIENNPSAIKMLIKNKTKFEASTFFIFKKKVDVFLQNIKESYDLIFADPPYDDIDYELLMNRCIEKLEKNGKLIVEMRNNSFSFHGSIEKKYGDTKILIYNKT